MIYWIIATLCAFFIKGLCGFANTMVFQTILSFGVDNVMISPVELVLGYPSNLILSIKERKHINWRLCLPLAVIVSLGSIPGIWFLKNADTHIVKIIFGIFIILIGFEMLYREIKNVEAKSSKLVMGIVAILSGVFCGLYGIGVLLGAYFNRVSKDSHEFKANLCMVFFIENTMRIILYSISGIISFAIVKQAVILIPFMLMGVFLGMKSSEFLDEKMAKKLVIIMLIISGFALLVNNI